MASLSDSYAKTLVRASAKDLEGAGGEFHANFLPAVTKLYGEVASTYPKRFAKIGEWCGWAKEMQALSTKADGALAAKNAVESAKLLAALREHFYRLHRMTETQRTNDFIYAFRMAAMKESPLVADLQEARQALQRATPSAKAAADPVAYEKAREQWAQRVDAILKDGTVEAAEVESLRAATEAFYQFYGIQFE